MTIQIGASPPSITSGGQLNSPQPAQAFAGQRFNHSARSGISPAAAACIAGLRRRCDASYRLPPLASSGHRDPWHWDDEPMAGYEAAAYHLLGHGLLPAPNRAALQTMWRRGGPTRDIAMIIAQSWEMVA